MIVEVLFSISNQGADAHNEAMKAVQKRMTPFIKEIKNEKAKYTIVVPKFKSDHIAVVLDNVSPDLEKKIRAALAER